MDGGARLLGIGGVRWMLPDTKVLMAPSGIPGDGANVTGRQATEPDACGYLVLFFRSLFRLVVRVLLQLKPTTANWKNACEVRGRAQLPVGGGTLRLRAQREMGSRLRISGGRNVGMSLCEWR
ncbi:hypothetical protein TraAM80_06547 [Trypanosoma rangeli]|uniref:Uncharacterized protein n=1 Tax=Trypanosoma rangeli TaxID=5698 RepID=A0A3R7LS12_TRYRA|nr:uncharacterized protein TraAM80_06547 [Trypanosoma rangeli]RNF02253.1 hypothetical protein TraAM80_06547 [Trypanosoma rangeli]|eukprot:RNF02253.1 hypothetical protein TraAM80_06547 [Trypanosoma rangeli]